MTRERQNISIGNIMGIHDGLISEYPLGERIRYYRKFRGMTQKDLAKKVGLSQGAIALIEKSQLMCSVKNLREICDALEVSISYILAEDNVLVIDLNFMRGLKSAKELSAYQKRSLIIAAGVSKRLGVK